MSKQGICGIISFKNIYKTFAEMLKAEGVKNMLPFLENRARSEKLQ